MKQVILAVSVMFLASCGYSSRDNELIGQIKKVKHVTPIICPNWWNADVTLGVMKNGTGSMSTQDVWLRVEDPKLLEAIKNANESGKIVKIKYDTDRVAICVEENLVTSVTILE